MALGDISRTAGFPRQVGNMWMIVGTLEASSTGTAFALTDSSSTLVSCSVQNEDDVDTYTRVALNSSAGVADTLQGSVYVDTSSAGVDTFRFCAFYI